MTTSPFPMTNSTHKFPPSLHPTPTTTTPTLQAPISYRPKPKTHQRKASFIKFIIQKTSTTITIIKTQQTKTHANNSTHSSTNSISLTNLTKDHNNERTKNWMEHRWKECRPIPTSTRTSFWPCTKTEKIKSTLLTKPLFLTSPCIPISPKLNPQLTPLTHAQITTSSTTIIPKVL